MDFLSEKIDQGFMFPVNPKWILCDQGWKVLYDKQMNSTNKSTQKAMAAWYPPTSGVQELIDRVSTKHPKCFQVLQGPYRMEQQGYSPLRQACEEGEEISGDTQMDMALLELNHDRVLKKALKVFRAILFANRLNRMMKTNE